MKFLTYLSVAVLAPIVLLTNIKEQVTKPQMVTFLNYKRSPEHEGGVFNKQELALLYAKLIEHDKDFDSNKPVLIHYVQKGKTCEEEDNVMRGSVLYRLKNKSAEMCKMHNIQNVLIYTRDSYANPYAFGDKDWIRDNNKFFQKNIFTSNKHCQAYALIQPDGHYVLRYGGNYMDEVENKLQTLQK